MAGQKVTMFARGLFIGRFQPLHKGHVDAIRQALNRSEKLVVAIGSDNKVRLRNPYSANERAWMLHIVFSKEIREKSMRIIQVKDCENHKKWIEDIIAQAGNVQAVFTRNPVTYQMFKRQGNNVFLLKKNILISGTDLRALIKEKDPAWKQYVPRAVQTMIEKRQNN